jgi:hypothetical protein
VFLLLAVERIAGEWKPPCKQTIGMFACPVTGYFKQLEDYCVAKAASSRGLAQSNSTNRNPDAEYPTDTVHLSRPERPPNCYFYLDTLTVSDKAVVKAATGWDLDADPLGKTASPEAFQLVGRLNLDRSCGALTGGMSPAYIDNLIEESLSPQPNEATVPLSVLYKAQAYLSQTASRK